MLSNEFTQKGNFNMKLNSKKDFLFMNFTEICIELLLESSNLVTRPFKYFTVSQLLFQIYTTGFPVMGKRTS